MPQIRLYDASTGELAPIARGDSIRVEIHTADLATQGQVDVASSRPFVLFSLLQRLLESEGLPTRFLFGSPGAGEVLRELDARGGMPEAAEAEYEYDEADGADDFAHAGEADQPLVAAPEGRCVDIRFGAAREGELEWAGGESAGRMTLNQALRRFGHHALVFYLMGTHYSQPLGDPVSGMKKAAKHVARLCDTFRLLREGEPSPPDMREHVDAFREALATDLDTPAAFVALFQWVLEAEQRGGGMGDEDLCSMLELLELGDLSLRARV